MTTEKRIQAILTASPALLTEVDRVLSGASKQQESIDRIVRRKEAAHLLGRSPRAVDYLSAQGSLEKVKFPGHTRGAGYRLSSIQALLCGKV
jgi:hypothetical protein